MAVQAIYSNTPVYIVLMIGVEIISLLYNNYYYAIKKSK